MLNKIALAILTLFIFASDVFAATVIDLDGRYSISASKSSKLDTRYTFYEKNKATNSTTSRTLSSNVWSRNISVTGNYSYSYKVCYTKYENEEDRTICGSSKAYANEYLVVLTPSAVNVPATSDNGNVKVSWVAPGATSYQLQQRKGSGSWVTIYTGSATSKNVSGLANGKYSYRISAFYNSTQGGYKTSGNVTVLLPPATPSNLNASASIDGNVTLDWSAISSATNYTLQERVGSGSWSTLSTSITATNTLLNRGAGSYRYRVAACEGQNCSDYRESSSVSVSPPAPGTVTSLSGAYTVTAPSGDPLIDKYKFEETNVATGAKVKREENDNRWSRNITSTGLYSYTYQSCKSELGDNGEDSSVCHSRKSISTSYLVVLTPSSINVPATSYNGNVNVSWVAAGATSYLLEYQKNGTGDWVDAYKDSATQATVSNLTDGDYVFRISAFYDTTQGNYKAASIVTKVSLTPGAASAITVPTSTVTDRTFPISWPTVSNAKTYTLQEGRLSGDGQYSLGWATIDENISAKNSTDSEITYHHKAPKGGLYKYQVKACNAICSDYTISNRVSVVEPPLPIGNLTLTQPIENKNSLIVSWDTVDKATFYNVEMNVDKTDWQPAKLELDTTSHTVAIESVNASYQFRVSACNVAGCSEFTLSPILPILFAPKAPEMISVPDSLVTNGQLEVRWAASLEATHYILEEKLDDNIWSSPPSDEFLKFTELTDIKITRSNLPDGEYTYRVAACKELFCSDFVTSDVVTLVTAPSPPDSVSVENTQLGKLNVFWDEVAEATSYKLEWSVDNGEWTILSENIEEATLEHAIKLSGNYQFRVASCNELCGNYTYSPNIEYRDPFSYVDGLIPHGDFESGNDFSGRNSNVVTSFETVSPIAGDRSLKVNANGWDYIFYKAKNFTESNGFISNAQLTGFIKSSRQLRITVRVSYVGGTWSDSSSNSQVIGDFNEVVPISVAVETDTSRQVSLISLYIASGCGTCENPAEFIVDNIQLQTVESSKSIFKLSSLLNFTDGVLKQLGTILNLQQVSLYEYNSFENQKEGDCFFATLKNNDFQALSASGKFKHDDDTNIITPDSLSYLNKAYLEKKSFFEDDIYVGYFHSNELERMIFLYIEGCRNLSDNDKKFLEVFSNNISISFENICLIDKNKEKDIILSHQTKLATMGEMIDNISHQWKKPLSLITTNASGMKMMKEHDILKDKDFFNYCDSIIETSEFLSHTIEDFRYFFKEDKIKSYFTLKDVIDKALFLLSAKLERNDIQIVNNISNIEVFSLKNEFIQAVINIINNSIDALFDVEEKRIFLKDTVSPENILSLDIKDNAGGITENILDKVFEQYFSTKMAFTKKCW